MKFFLIIFLPALLLSILYSCLEYIDMKIKYNIINLNKYDSNDGNTYFAVTYLPWQINKVKRAIEIYHQNYIIDFNRYKYLIINHGTNYPTSNEGFFFEKEIRFWVAPLSILSSNSNTKITVNNYANGNISINVNNNSVFNDIANIKDYISHDINIDNVDKNVMLEFIENIIQNNIMNKKEAESAYNTFLKYEPLLSFALNILSLIVANF